MRQKLQDDCDSKNTEYPSFLGWRCKPIYKHQPFEDHQGDTYHGNFE